MCFILSTLILSSLSLFYFFVIIVCFMFSCLCRRSKLLMMYSAVLRTCYPLYTFTSKYWGTSDGNKRIVTIVSTTTSGKISCIGCYLEIFTRRLYVCYCIWIDQFIVLALNFISCVIPLVCMLMLWFAFARLIIETTYLGLPTYLLTYLLTAI